MQQQVNESADDAEGVKAQDDLCDLRNLWMTHEETL